MSSQAREIKNSSCHGRDYRRCTDDGDIRAASVSPISQKRTTNDERRTTRQRETRIMISSIDEQIVDFHLPSGIDYSMNRVRDGH